MGFLVSHRRDRARLNLLVAALSLAFVSQAQAGVPGWAEDRMTFNLSSQPLSASLRALSGMTRQPIQFDESLLAGKQAPALRGSFVPGEAIERLLVGSGWVAVRTSSGAFALEPASRASASAQAVDAPILPEIQVVAARDQVKQAPGVSIITAEDLARTPVTNDVAEIVRRQPGVNFTGNTASGVRGNQRQIDIRGMGPENTLILIDGKPVLSRNSVRYGRSGERDTRGDSNWVPPEAIESIEVLRGPAAARYGSGSAGGVVNIRTKPATVQSLNVDLFTNVPEDSREGDTRRVNVLASGPMSEMLSFRLYGSFNVTDHDEPGLNGPTTVVQGGRGGSAVLTSAPAGREGVENRDFNARLMLRANAVHRFDLDAGWSRQANRYAGDTASGTTTDSTLMELANVGARTNRMTRTNVSLTHYGAYDFGASESFIQWERTHDTRLVEPVFGYEGLIDTTGGGAWETARLGALAAKTEFHLPLRLGYEQVLTLGAELRRESLDDPATILTSADFAEGVNLGIPNAAADRSTKSSARLFGLYAESNLDMRAGLVLTPGVRLDHHDKFGAHVSPSLNATQALGGDSPSKGGVARAFKAPNLFQLNPNYVGANYGQGCPVTTLPCYILGNENLDPEVSLNKEVGLAFQGGGSWAAGLTWFHNRYKNRIVSGHTSYGTIATGLLYQGRPLNVANIYRWENSGPATVAGFEGSLTVPLARTLVWSSNMTYMYKSEDDQGQPLSLVPEYTLNTWLDWQASDALSLNVGATRYGRIEARTISSNNLPLAEADTVSRGAYTVFNLGLNYRVNKIFRLNAGVKNLFDRQLLRTGDGANTFNEPGRSYYVGLNAQF